MKRFYIVWFFFCAVWGYLSTQMSSAFTPAVAQASATFAVGAISIFVLIAIEIWRAGPSSTLSQPSLSLKPWNQPVGLMLFVLLTFLFSSIWGLGISVLSPTEALLAPLYMFSLASGGLVGLSGAHRVFRSRFRA
jgi:hypothetical protein